MDNSSQTPPTSIKPPVKPALKHPAKTDVASVVDSGKEKHLTWDEHAIEEHDVLRGTRMKASLFAMCQSVLAIEDEISLRMDTESLKQRCLWRGGLPFFFISCRELDLCALSAWVLIDEPNTPYTHYDHSDDDQSTSSAPHPRSPDEKSAHHAPPLAWNALESKLQVVADKRDACPHSPAPSRDGASDSEGEMELKRRKAKQEEHDRAFKDHRKKHYNEAEVMKKWRMEHMDDEDEDED